MAKFNYYLRDIKSKKETPIVLFIRWDNQLLKFATKQTIHPKYWDDKKQIIIEQKTKPELSEKKTKLLNDLADINHLFSRFENDNKRTPTKQELKTLLETEIHNVKPKETKVNLLQFINRFIEESKTRNNEKTGKPIAKSTIHTYQQLKTNIENFSKFKKTLLEFEHINYDFYIDFNAYLISENLATNTIGKRIAILKAILNDATERGLNRNLAYKSTRFKVTREKTDNIYLNESELNEFRKLDLSNNKRLDNVRDLFLIGCWTGLRFSDFTRLKQEHIKGNDIEIETQKTRESVLIPMHPVVRLIFDKYEGKLPKKLSNQKMNEYLKEIGQMIESLNIKTFKTITQGGFEKTTQLEKYKRITTHTARRSFASNLYLGGVPSQTIMKITGHKTEKSFNQYIKITTQENANIIRMHWQKTNNFLEIG
jgi:integrase